MGKRGIAWERKCTLTYTDIHIHRHAHPFHWERKIALKSQETHYNLKYTERKQRQSMEQLSH